MDDRAFVGCDHVGSVLERVPDVVDSRLSGFDVERSSFKHDVGLGRVEPGVVVLALFAADSAEWIRTRGAQNFGRVKAGRVYLPADAPRGDACDAPLDAVALAQFGFFVLQKFNQRPVDVAEAEQAEVHGIHVCEPENIPSTGSIGSRPWNADVYVRITPASCHEYCGGHAGRLIFSAANFRG